jgi:hypothetical protein
MIAIKHFRKLVRDALQPPFGLYTVAVEELLAITCAQESLGATYLWQNDSKGFPSGPAIGPFQMEPATHDDLWNNFLFYRPILAKPLGEASAGRMAWDWYYAIRIARLNYYRFPMPIPNDLEGLIRYYKKYWNTDLGAATLGQVRSNYERFVG